MRFFAVANASEVTCVSIKPYICFGYDIFVFFLCGFLEFRVLNWSCGIAESDACTA